MAIFDLHHPLTFTFGVLGNLVSILVYLAPVPTFIRICREKSTMGFQALPYVVALFSSMLWMYYALLKKNANLLISINSFGCFIETLYIAIFLLYASNKARKHAFKLIGLLNIALFMIIFLFSFFVFKGHIRVQVVGWICVGISVCVFAAPLNIAFQVVRTKSVEFMPFSLSFFLTLSAVMWFAYGLLQKDMCVALPNVLGFLLGVVQMLLYGMYRNSSPELMVEEEKKQPEHHVVNMLNLGTNPQDDGRSNNIKDQEKDNNGQEDEKRKGENQVIAINVEMEPCRQGNLNLDSPVIVVCTA